MKFKLNMFCWPQGNKNEGGTWYRKSDTATETLGGSNRQEEERGEEEKQCGATSLHVSGENKQTNKQQNKRSNKQLNKGISKIVNRPFCVCFAP